ncbi:MAG: type II toxin-antitoxin system RelE/ParE family toxin [Hyphomonadaceae bacterium]|nr:type II toxin-antitoxin system RelE/ParE family toxin [Hyphomonadaceae bacterium]
MIIYAPDAERDVERLHQRFVTLSAIAATTFMARLTQAEVRIEARPRTYRLLNDRETRRYSFRINRISYLVDYRIEPDQIVILRVWHGRQDRPT